MDHGAVELIGDRDSKTVRNTLAEIDLQETFQNAGKPRLEV